MPTYWDAFLDKYDVTKMSIEMMLEAFWHYCNDKDMSKWKEYETGLD